MGRFDYAHLLLHFCFRAQMFLIGGENYCRPLALYLPKRETLYWLSWGHMFYHTRQKICLTCKNWNRRSEIRYEHKKGLYSFPYTCKIEILNNESFILFWQFLSLVLLTRNFWEIIFSWIKTFPHSRWKQLIILNGLLRLDNQRHWQG